MNRGSMKQLIIKSLVTAFTTLLSLYVHAHDAYIDGIYYNLECNCIGTVLLGAGLNREHRERANQNTLGSIQRWASLGRKPFGEILHPTEWEVALILPYTAFFKHRIRRLEGNVVKANFYKCGDRLPQPHFLSWQPIALEKPNFHCPQFFGELAF